MELADLPVDVAAEQAVLGSMLVSVTVADDMASRLRGADFYRPAHELVFDAIVDLRARREPADPLTVAGALAKAGTLQQAGGQMALAELIAGVSVTANATHYADIVREGAVRRRLMDAALQIRTDAAEGAGGTGDLLARSQALLDGISPPTEQQVGRRVMDLWPAVIDLVEQGGTRGPALPWPDLDGMLHGLQGGSLYVVGARPGVGKSMFAQSLMAHWAGKHDLDVYAASLEMSAAQVSMRILSAKSGVYFSKLVTGTLTEADWVKVSAASQWPGAARMTIVDDPGLTMAAIRAGARDRHRRGRLGLVIIDYAGLVTPRDSRLPRQEQVAEVAREAKKLAMELDVPVVLLSQLNRESAGGRAPVLQDLRESGALEQDADAVILMHIPSDDNAVPVDWDLRLIVAKNRAGAQGEVRLVRQGFIMRIVSREKGGH